MKWGSRLSILCAAFSCASLVHSSENAACAEEVSNEQRSSVAGSPDIFASYLTDVGEQPDQIVLAGFKARNSCSDQDGCGGCTSDTSGLFRSAMSGDGWLDVDAAYRGEVFNNMRGGSSVSGATAYTGCVDLLFAADLDQFSSGPGGLFVLHFQSLDGQGIADRYVGAQQQQQQQQRVSNIDGNPGAGFALTQVSQFFYQRGFGDGKMTVKVGKILADSEFAIQTLGGDYINTSFGWTHTLPLAAYPNPTAGVVTHFQLTEALGLKVGVFDGAPDGGNWGFSDTGDVNTLFEIRRHHSLGCGQLDGDIHAGYWFHNGTFSSHPTGTQHTGNYGVYWGISQMLTRECRCNPDDTQGLGTFLHFGWAPEDRNRVQQYWGGGLVYRGLIDGRDTDTCGIGIANMVFSDNLTMSLSNETVVELFYKIRVGDRLVLQPDFQFISHPGGNLPDSSVFGLRFEVAL
ncbi:MAG: carbohydrate porin [Fuerstiella sp.]